MLVGYRHYDQKKLPVAYPFGHGLGYTRFAYGAPRVQRARGEERGDRVLPGDQHRWPSGLDRAPALRRPADAATLASSSRPKALKAFSKVTLAPGDSRRVTLRLDRRALSYWDTEADGWRVADGCYGLRLGKSSRDIVHRARVGWRADCGQGVRLRARDALCGGL